MTETDDQRLARFGETAAMLKRDNLFGEIMGQAEAAYLDALLACDEKDDLGRFRFAQALKVCRAVKMQIHCMVESGKVSTRMLEDIHKKKGVFRR